MLDATSSFNKIKIDGNNNQIIIGSNERFEPMIDWLKKEIEFKVKGIGRRYLPLQSGYEDINISTNYKKHFLTLVSITYIKNKLSNNNEQHVIDKIGNINNIDNLKYIDDLKSINNQIKLFSSENFLVNLDIFKVNIKKLLQEYKQLKSINDIDYNGNTDILLSLKYRTQDKTTISKRSYHKKLLDNDTKFRKLYQLMLNYLYETQHNIQQIRPNIFIKKVLLVRGEALIGKTHLFCDTALNQLKNNQPTLLFFGHDFVNDKTIISNMINNLGITNCSDEAFLDNLNKLGLEHKTKTLIMIDAINETKDMALWRDGLIEFCEKIKSYDNLALALSIRDVEKNKLITSDNEDYILNEIVEVEHKGFEGIEIEAMQIFCKALDVEFPKVPIHTHRLFVNPGILFLYIEIIKDSTKKINTDVINPTIIFKTYLENLNKKFYQKYTNEVDEDDEVIQEAIKARSYVAN